MINKEKNLGYIIIETDTVSAQYKTKSCEIINTNKNKVVAEGILQEANRTNRNKRFYSDSQLFPQITCPRTIELISTGNMRSENGHPLSQDLPRQQTIDPNKCCAIFLSMWVEGNFVKGTFRGTNNALGEEFDQDLRDGFKPSWSLRALGTIKQDPKRGAMVEGLKLITYDRVIYPSHDKAYTTGILSESAGFNNIDNKVYLEENDKGLVIPITNEKIIDYIKTESTNLKMLSELYELDLKYNNIDILGNGSQVKLTNSEDGNIVVMNLESYIHNEIMNDCVNRVEG